MFGENLDPVVLGKAEAVAQNCDLFVAVGTLLKVHPVAGLARLAVDAGARLVIVNAEPTPYDPLADEVIREPISTALPALVRRIIADSRA
jgi:NAD-dependent deacetylase